MFLRLHLFFILSLLSLNLFQFLPCFFPPPFFLLPLSASLNLHPPLLLCQVSSSSSSFACLKFLTVSCLSPIFISSFSSSLTQKHIRIYTSFSHMFSPFLAFFHIFYFSSFLSVHSLFPSVHLSSCFSSPTDSILKSSSSLLLSLPLFLYFLLSQNPLSSFFVSVHPPYSLVFIFHTQHLQILNFLLTFPSFALSLFLLSPTSS